MVLRARPGPRLEIATLVDTVGKSRGWTVAWDHCPIKVGIW